MLLIVKGTPYEIKIAVDEGHRLIQLWTGCGLVAPFKTVDEALDFIESHPELLLEFKYLKLKEEVEKFLKKKSGYRELRKVLKEISS